MSQKKEEKIPHIIEESLVIATHQGSSSGFPPPGLHIQGSSSGFPPPGFNFSSSENTRVKSIASFITNQL